LADVVRLTVVGSQGEADVICSFLRTNGIECSERVADVSAERGGGFGGWREILVPADQLETARELLPSPPAER
jgi:hypothetical protein